MPRRKFFFGMMALALVAATRMGGAPAKEPDPVNRKSAAVQKELLLKQQLLARRFDDLKAGVLRWKQRLPQESPEEKLAAKILEKILTLDSEPARLVQLLKSKSLANLSDTQDALALSNRLAWEMAVVLSILRTDHLSVNLRADRELLEGVLDKKRFQNR